MGKTKPTPFEYTDLPEHWRTICQAERPDLNPDHVFDAFADHWESRRDKRALKSNWTRTWTVWVRRERSGVSVTPARQNGAQQWNQNWGSDNGVH